MSDSTELGAALNEARTLAAILDALARSVWHNAHDGADCPDNCIPSDADLIAWQPNCPETAQAEAREAVAAMRLIGPDAKWIRDLLSAPLAPDAPDMPPVEDWRWQAMGSYEWKAMEAALRERVGADVDAVLATLELHGAIVRRPRLVFAAGLGVDPRTDEHVHGVAVWEAPEVHRLWTELPKHDQRRHPLAPLVAAWLDKPAPRDPFDLRSRASLPRLHRIEPGEAPQLPAFPGANPPEPGHQLDLPGSGPAVEGCPSWLLWMFAAAGGESMAQGRGAPWRMRLFVGALLHVSMPDRTGRWVTLRFPHLHRHEADWPVSGVRSVESWLHPEVWANFRRDWPRLPSALDAMRERLSYVPVAGIGSVAVVFPSVIPRSTSDPFVEFTVRIPASAAHGARLDWPLLCRYGTESAALYRAYLSTSAYFDHSARDGYPITAEIAAPVLDDDGKPKRRKGGVIVRSRHDTVPNPAARFVAPLSDADLARMIGFDSDNRDHRYKARQAFERLDADGVLDMQRKGSGVYLYGPRNGAR